MDDLSSKESVDFDFRRVRFKSVDQEPLPKTDSNDSFNLPNEKELSLTDVDANIASVSWKSGSPTGATSIHSHHTGSPSTSVSDGKLFAMRLSVLKDTDELISGTDLTNLEHSVSAEEPCDQHSSDKEETENSDVGQKEWTLNKQQRDDPPLQLIWCFTLIVYCYLVLPVPFSLQVSVISFIWGIVVTATALCLIASKSKRPSCNVPTIFFRHSDPVGVYNSVCDFHKPIKGWMNEAFTYDPETYHVSNTHSVYVTLDGSTMRLQTPYKSLPRRCVHGEKTVPLSNVTEQRLLDITNAKIWLQPPDLTKKRVWSKKYPICVEISSERNQGASGAARRGHSTVSSGCSSSQLPNILYLFGRTNHQKEEWFYRIQRSINLALHNAKRAVVTSSVGEISDEWSLISDPKGSEAATYVASTLTNVETFNDNPERAFKDYIVHISRLFPETPTEDKTKPDINSDSFVGFAEPRAEVSWLNVVIGRVMFDFFRQPSWATWLSNKIQRKLDKVKLPYFIEELKLDEINLGSTAPLVHCVSQPKLDSKGVWFMMDITYSGSLQMTFKTKMVLTKVGKKDASLAYKVDRSNKSLIVVDDSDDEDSAESSEEEESSVSRILGQVQNAVSNWDVRSIAKEASKASRGPAHQSSTSSVQQGPASSKRWLRLVDSITKSKYFQKAAESEFIRKKLESVSNTPMLLSVELVELRGTLAVNIPPPPTDRLWYGFNSPPHMVLKAQPQVGERVVKTSHITDWIENKLQEEFVKILVMPNMDDIPIPVMFSNRSTQPC